MRDRSYTESLDYNDFYSRLEYLKIKELYHVSPRDISNRFYKSAEWLRVREEVIKRDRGYDLGVKVKGNRINGPIIIHHINPLTPEDLENWNVKKLFDLDNLISCSIETHNIIHYGEKSTPWSEREEGDTKLW